MTGNRDKSEFTPDNLRTKAALFRQWADEIQELADHLDEQHIPSVGLRFEKSLAIGLDRVLSWVYDAKKSVSSMMFHGELATHYKVAEKPVSYATKPATINDEHAARSAEAQRKAAPFTKTKPGTGTEKESKPKKNSG
jgi:hypothetical protein